jgi:NAD(P)-dependent dehydrogenase (short-subunit alcohol dehydrogenase family)
MRHNPQPGGRIVVTGSIGGVFPHQSYPVYCGTKASVNHFIRGVAPLLKQKENILINCVMPGIVNTPIVPPEMIEAVTLEW